MCSKTSYLKIKVVLLNNESCLMWEKQHINVWNIAFMKTSNECLNKVAFYLKENHFMKKLFVNTLWDHFGVTLGSL